MPPDGIAERPEPAPEALRPDRPTLAAFVRDPDSETVLRKLLPPEAGTGATIRRGDLAAARAALQSMPSPATLLVDVSGQDHPLLALEQLADVVEPGTTVLAIGDRDDMGFYREVTRGLGVAEYLYKPLNQEMVARHFLPLVQRRHGAELGLRSGRVVTVTGVRGGVGATTVAASLALHMAEGTRRNTLLIDADLHRGSAALQLGAQPGSGLRSALENPDRVDELFADRAVSPVGDRLHLLAAEEALDQLPQIPPGAAGQVVEVLRRRYNLVVIDVPGTPSALNNELLGLAHQRVMVMDPTLAAVRDMLRFAALPNAPAQLRRAIVVLNRDGAPGALALRQIAEAVQSKPDVVVPWLPKKLIPAATLGAPAVRGSGRFRDAVRRLAAEIAPDAQPPAAAGRLGRMFRK